jgi:capsular exopolysaccharide synthesis family protein
MGRTYEAIQRAEKEYKRILRETGIGPEERLWLTPQSDASTPPKTHGYDDIKTKLLTRYANESLKVILLTGPAHGTGTTTIALTLAKDIVSNSRKKVLLVDANLRTPILHKIFKIKPSVGISDLLSENGGTSFNFFKVGPGKLYLFPAGLSRNQKNGYFESQRFDQFLNHARKLFDYVIIDSAPVTRFQDSQSICSKVDGVIVVLSQGRTRRQVAIRIKQELEEAGARILGVVLNRRKYHIPDWLYKRL